MCSQMPNLKHVMIKKLYQNLKLTKIGANRYKGQKYPPYFFLILGYKNLISRGKYFI